MDKNWRGKKGFVVGYEGKVEEMRLVVLFLRVVLYILGWGKRRAGWWN